MAHESFPADLLARVVSDHVDAPPDALTFEPCRTGKFNTTYFVEGGPRPFVLRIAPPDDRSRMLFYEHRMMRQEPDVHARVQARTEVPVPTILAHDAGHERIDRDYLVMERMPGTPISHHGSLSRAACAEVFREVGRALAQVHAIQGDRYGYVGAHRPMEPQHDWNAAFRQMWNLLLDDIEQCGGYDHDEAAHMRGLLDRYLVVFSRSVPASRTWAPP